MKKLLLISLIFSCSLAQAESSLKNKLYFKNKVYPVLKREEVDPRTNKLCHIDNRGFGEFACVGVTFKANKKFFLKELNAYHISCFDPFSGRNRCKVSLFEHGIKEYYYKKYAKPFKHCSLRAFAMIIDSAVLEGVKVAKRHYKGMGCNKNFDAPTYTLNRIKRFKTLKYCHVYCAGWIKRAKRKLDEYFGR